jgi:tRNA threonylcarbamoyl adenosine modification protein YeaZ
MVSVLGLDATGSACSAALLRDDRALAHRFAAMERGQAEALVPMIASVLAEAALPVAALDLIAVTVGPGAFTGVRIGLAAARGLALASGVPALGVTSFAAVAAAVAPAIRRGRHLVVAPWHWGCSRRWNVSRLLKPGRCSQGIRRHNAAARCIMHWEPMPKHASMIRRN